MRRFLNQLWIVIGALVATYVITWAIYLPTTDQRGIWRATTTGQILTLTPFQATLYSETASSCVRQLRIPAHMKLAEFAEGATVQVIEDDLHLSVDGPLGTTAFTRIDALPDTCGPADPDAPARATFDALWNAMNDHYAHFDLRDIDWDARRALAPPPNIRMSDADLFARLSDTLRGINDEQVHLGSPSGYFFPATPPAWVSGALTRDSLTQTARDIVGTPLTASDLSGVEYVLLPDGVGYILIRHLLFNAPLGAREEPAMALAFGEVADALQSATSLIIDLRYTPGGSQAVAFGIASHFIDTPLDVLRKTSRTPPSQSNRSGQSDPFTATLRPFDTTPLMQPVTVLTSGLTTSAAEILTLALREMPQVTVMGEATYGALSDIASFTLPNGWSVGVSHQTYATMDGTVFEGTGIPPDIAIPTDAAALQIGEDPVLRAAFARARAQ